MSAEPFLAGAGQDERLPAGERRTVLAFIVRVAELLHAYGTPAHRLEEALARCAGNQGLAAQFVSGPTSIQIAFGAGLEQRTLLLRVDPGEIDLGKLIEFDAVLDDVEDGRIDAAAGLARLDAIAGAAPRYGFAPVTLAYGVASAGAASFLGGGAKEVALSFLLGLATGLLARVLGRRSAATRIFEPLAAFLAAFGALLAAGAFPPLADDVVVLSAVIVLVPGLSITLALNELATRHLVSGTARMAGALSIFLTMALGVALGRRTATFLAGAAPPGAPIPLPDWLEPPTLVLASLAFLVLFQARAREAPEILFAGALAFYGARFGRELLGLELGAFGGALVLGVASNAYARLADRPASIPLVPGILLLVPGSIGFRSVGFFLVHDVLSGMEAAFQMALVATSLVGGLLLANVVLPARRSL